MRGALIALILLASGPLFANGSGPTQGPPGPPGPQGKQGPAGPAGQPGSAGVDVDSPHKVDVGLGLGVQYKDTRNWNFGGNYNYFIRNNEHRLLPVVLTYKLGKDHQDEEMRAMAVQLDALTAIVERSTRKSAIEVPVTPPNGTPVPGVIRGR